VVEGTLVLDGVGLQNCYHFAEGGAVLVSGSGSFQFLNSRAEGNSSTWYGGAVYSSGSVHVQNSLITGNEGYEGGALFIDWGTTTIEGTTVSENSATSLGGGGITNHYSGNLTIRESLIQRNQAPGKYGGGLQILSSGQTLVENSTFIHNSASHGGAVSCGYSCDLTLRGVTIAANSATTAGGGIDQDNGTIDLEGSIISDNTGASGPDIAGTVNSLGYNLIEDATGATITGDTTGNLIGSDPQLGLLADNGGATQTCALPKGSPAVDAGPPACGGLSTDQRGTPRPLDGDDSGTSECDIGAFELDTALFRDGFESGDLSAWSSAMP
jgi:predicted outer membrane repeat protein